MAQLRKVVPSAPISDFRQSAPVAGQGLMALADMANTAYETLLPAATKNMEERGAELGREMAKQQIGTPSAPRVSTSGGGFRAALRQSESGGNSTIVNSEGYGGLYQWGQPRLDDYNRATGQNITMAQFLGDANIQEGAQDWHEADILGELGGYVGREVNGQVLDEGAIIGMAHLGGTGGARKYIETGGAYDPADSNGTNLSDYARKFGGQSVSVSSKGSAEYVPAMIRQADGKLASRLFSPLSDPIMQAHNAAAGIAYASEMQVQGMTDLMGLSEQFILNPDGFREAATAYVDDLVGKAPEMFQGDVRATMEKEVQRRFLGMMEEKQSDIRQRADNSSRALMDKWSENLVEALQGGDVEEIGGAMTELQSVLRARESLPGAAWTPEQSANVFADAQREADRRSEQRNTAQKSEWKGMLSTVYDAAINGMSSVHEALLENPQVRAMLGPEAEKAAAAVTLRNELPSFMRMTPAEQRASLDEMRAQPVSEQWQRDIYVAAEDAHKANAAAWEADPIKRAAEVLPNKPPALPEPDPDNPGAFIDALTARAAYGEKLKADGYTDVTAYLTDEEAKDFGAAFGKDTPPELKAAMAGAVVAGLGDKSAQFFSEIKNDDPVLKMSGMLMARGGNQAVAVEAMRGQAMLDEGLVQRPSKATTLAAVSPDAAVALSAVPAADQAGVLQMATAIYASRARGTDPNSDAATALMQEAVQAALGQDTNRRGEKTGGVQVIGSAPTLLPPGMSGDKLTSALKMAFKADMTLGQQMGFPGGALDVKADLWLKAGALSAPILEGRPLQQSDLAYAQLTPIGGTMYRLQINVNGNIVEPHPEGADLLPFIFDAAKLIEAAR